jgi:hypothetical protein
VTWVLLELLAPGSACLFFNDAEFALKLRIWIVEGPWAPGSRRFANG